MDRFFCPDLSGEVCELAEEEARHLARALRAKVGDPLELFDGRGNVADGVIEYLQKGTARVRITHRAVHPPAEPMLTLAVGFPKGDRLDWMVEKLQELGAFRLVPLKCRRSVVEPRETKLARLEKLVIAAAKQSRANHLLQIDPLQTPEEFVLAEKSRANAPLAVLDVEGDTSAIDWLTESQSASCRNVLIGPEGGWAPEERRFFADQSLPSITLGETILRIETAAISIAALASCTRSMKRQRGGVERQM